MHRRGHLEGPCGTKGRKMALLESMEWDNWNHLLFSPVNEELVQAGVDEVDNQGTVVTTNLHIHKGKRSTLPNPPPFSLASLLSTSLTPRCLGTRLPKAQDDP